MRTRIILALVLAALWCAAAVAQQTQPVTYVSDFYVKPGKEDQFLNLVKKYDAPVVEQLMKDGAVLAWGVDVPIQHVGESPNFSIWWDMPDMAALDKVFAAYDAAEKLWAADDKKAADEARQKKQPAPKSGLEQFFETIDLSKHRDWIFRSLIARGSSAPPTAGAKPYTWLSLTRVKPGKGGDFRQLWEKYIMPTYEKLLAEGDIYAFGYGVEEAKSTDEFTHFVWVSLPNLGAREKMRAAFAAVNAVRSEETRRQITEAFLAVTDASASRQYVLRSVIFHAAGQK